MRKILLIFCVLVVLLFPGWAWSATKITSGYTAYIYYCDRPVVHLSNGQIIVGCVDYTHSEMRLFYSTNGGVSFSEFSGTPPVAYKTTQSPCLATDGTNIYVIWYYSSTALYYAEITPGTGWTYAVGSNTGYTVSVGSYPWLCIALDASNVPHIVFTSGSAVYYGNYVTGSWNSAVQLSGASYYPSLTIDTNSNDPASRYNVPQISALNSTTNHVTAYLGNQNNATSFSSSSPQNQPFKGRPTSIAVDSNGATNISFVNSSGYLNNVYLSASGTWTTATAWTLETIEGDNYNDTGCSLAINGTARYAFECYTNTNAVDYITDPNYTGWGSRNQLEAPTAKHPKAAWQYGNNPGYSTGIDFVYDDGPNIWWDILPLSTYTPPQTLGVAPANIGAIMNTTAAGVGKILGVPGN
jgi:hypothetical protein